jgi:pseudouridine synthase
VRPAQAARKAPEQRVLKTLDRVLSKAGLCSRTEAAEWIKHGRVKVNAKTIRDPEHWVDVDSDAVVIDGRPLRAERKVYLLLYKPKGYLTTYKDPDGRPTVYDLLGKVDQWVFPVGRLDQDTSGLLILTNDTEFAEHITNPEFHVPKTYLVKASTLLTDEQLTKLRDGLELKDGMTRPARVKRVRDSESKTFFEMTITEGRNRQVRRMVEALESQVLKLVRVAVGPVRIEKLQIGHWRHLAPDEVRALRKSGARTKGSGIRTGAGDGGHGGEGHS